MRRKETYSSEEDSPAEGARQRGVCNRRVGDDGVETMDPLRGGVGRYPDRLAAAPPVSNGLAPPTWQQQANGERIEMGLSRREELFRGLGPDGEHTCSQEDRSGNLAATSTGGEIGGVGEGRANHGAGGDGGGGEGIGDVAARPDEEVENGLAVSDLLRGTSDSAGVMAVDSRTSNKVGDNGRKAEVEGKASTGRHSATGATAQSGIGLVSSSIPSMPFTSMTNEATMKVADSRFKTDGSLKSGKAGLAKADEAEPDRLRSTDNSERGRPRDSKGLGQGQRQAIYGEEHEDFLDPPPPPRRPRQCPDHALPVARTFFDFDTVSRFEMRMLPEFFTGRSTYKTPEVRGAVLR